MLRRQTVWLLTMLTLMVVLSTYYLFNDPEQPDYAALNDLIQDNPDSQEMGNHQHLESSELTDSDEESATSAESDDDQWIDTISQINGELDDVEFSLDEMGDSLDFFVAYRMKRDEQRAKKLETYQAMMNRPDATAQTVAEAQANIETLWDQEEAEYTLENMIKERGYPEALIIHNQNGGITVLVESEDGLDRKEVLDLIHLVREHTHVPGNMISVKYR